MVSSLRFCQLVTVYLLRLFVESNRQWSYILLSLRAVDSLFCLSVL